MIGSLLLVTVSRAVMVLIVVLVIGGHRKKEKGKMVKQKHETGEQKPEKPGQLPSLAGR